MGDLDQIVQQVMARSAALKLYARQWLDAATAEDAIQDALTSLLCQRQPPLDPVAWMYRAVRNVAIDRARATSRRTRREKIIAEERREWFEEQPGALLDAATAEQALAALDPATREIVVLRIWGDLNFALISEIAGMSLSAVHKKYTAGLSQLRNKLEQSCKNHPMI